MKVMRPFLPILIVTLGVFGIGLPLPSRAVEENVSLRGSPNSMVRQNEVAHALGYEFVQSPAEIESLVEEGLLVPVTGNEHYVVKDGVSHAYARPEIRLFIERLAAQYHEGTGELLVVTSLTRPLSQQPKNSHDLSVHPAGIAIDLRISSRRASRVWLESVLLKLERRRLLDVTRERWPPHYHVALSPEPYRAHVAGIIGEETLARALRFEEPEPKEEPSRRVTTVSLPAVEVVSNATAPSGDSTWMVILAVGPLALLMLVVLPFVKRSMLDPR
jgi:hypothetical protein